MIIWYFFSCWLAHFLALIALALLCFAHLWIPIYLSVAYNLASNRQPFTLRCLANPHWLAVNVAVTFHLRSPPIHCLCPCFVPTESSTRLSSSSFYSALAFFLHPPLFLAYILVFRCIPSRHSLPTYLTSLTSFRFDILSIIQSINFLYSQS